MLRKLVNWLLRLLRREKLFKYRFVDDVPDHLRSGTVYLIGNDGYFWQMLMICPCGCKKALYMNLIEDYDPYWKYEIRGKTISISPSINRMVGCRSHFFLKNGKIEWC